MIRTLIVDDQPLCRERLRGLLADEAEVEVVGECDDGCKAVVAIESLSPDLVFLDVEMPGLDGFHILENIDADRIPAVVFVTANDRYAARAFEVQAVDYVLKPIGRERLQRALNHVREKLARKYQIAPAESLTSLFREPPTPDERYLKRLILKADGKLLFLPTVDIDWVEADGNRLCFHVGSKVHSLRARMKVIESHLHPGHFVRIHRSTIVNIERIKEMRPRLHGDYFVILQDDKSLVMSAGYHDKLDELRMLQRGKQAWSRRATDRSLTPLLGTESPLEPLS
jgi:two-component system LytT family response regulator